MCAAMPDAPAPRLRSRLRDATTDAHARVDGLLMGGFNNADAYRAYLSGMAAFVAALLPAVQAQAATLRWPLPDWNAQLHADLAQAHAEPLNDVTPLAGCDRAQALGTLYVLEGSSLGARLLVRQAQALGYGRSSGAAFLHAHADGEDHQRWPRFLALLESENAPGTDAPACAAALDAFALAETCLRRAKERTT